MRGGEELLRRQCRVALAADVGAVVVVVGCHAKPCAELIADLPVAVCENTEWSEGLASSLRCATCSAIECQTEGLLVLPCDQYCITEEDLWVLRDAWPQSQGAACVSRYYERTGPPAIIPADCYDNVRQLPR